MPNITLNSTSAVKGGDLKDRVAKFDGDALEKLEEIQANFGAKGTAGKLRIIYTTKSNKDLQFDTRKKTWWGGLYTPSAERQRKNELALRELFNKAGKDLSLEAKQQFETHLDQFFIENPQGITDLASLIKTFKEISLAEKQGLLQSNVQPNLIADSEPQIIPQDSEKQIVEENNNQKNNKASVLEEPEVHEDDRILTESKQGQPIDGNPDSSFSSKIDDRGHGLEENIPHDIDGQVANQVPEAKDVLKNSSFISEEDPDDLNKSHNSLIHNEEQSIQNDVPFGSDLKVDEQAEPKNDFFDSVEHDQNEYPGHRGSNPFYRFSDIINPEPDPKPIPVPIPEPVINKEELRAEAAKELEDINALLNSSLPNDIDALSRKISEFQEARKKQHADLRERATEIQSRFNDPNNPPSISNYLSDLQKLNEDISKFNEDKLGDFRMDQIDEFQEKLQGARKTLQRFLPQDSFVNNIDDLFPEIQQINDLLSILEEAKNLQYSSTEIDNQDPKTDAINQIYNTAIDICKDAKNAIADQNSNLIYSNTIQKHQNDWKELASLNPHPSYNKEDFQRDLQKLDRVYQGVLEIKEKYNAVASDIAELREQFLEYNHVFKESLGENFQDGWNLLFLTDEEALAASQDRPDFALVLKQIDSLDAQIQTTTAELDQILEAKESMMTHLDNTFQESLALKAQNDLEIQDAENKKAAEQRKIQQNNDLEQAKRERIEIIQNSLDSAFAQSEGIITQESNNAFKKLQSEFPDTFDRKLNHIINMMESFKKEKIPTEIVNRLDKKLRDYLDNKINENPVDGNIRQDFREQISSKVREWTQRPFYSDRQKQNLQTLLSPTGSWGRQLTSLASSQLNEINRKKSIFQDKLNSLNHDLEIKHNNIDSDVRDLDDKIKDLGNVRQSDQQKLVIAESQKSAMEQVALAVNEILELLEGETDQTTLETAFKNLATKISETEAGTRSVDDILDSIIERIQDQDDDYSLDTLKQEYSLKEEERYGEIKLLQEKISNSEMEEAKNLEIKNQLLSDRKAISDEQIELTNSIRSLEREEEGIKGSLRQIGIEIE